MIAPHMLDWLRRPAAELPQINVAGRILPVVIKRMERARRLAMRLAPDGSEVRITMPRWTRTADALAFVQERSDWLELQLAKLPAPVELTTGTPIPYRGAQLALHHLAGTSRRVRIEDTALVLGGPAENLGPRLRRWLESEARRLMAEDLAYFCDRAGQTPPRLMLSSAQRRWGSCAHGGTIRINWRLIMAPDFVRRSVVAHEVAHLVHFDHSPRFHTLLAKIYDGDMAAANRWLKRDGRGLYQLFG